MDRYDRQLRLWGDDGQDRLQSAKVGILATHYHDNLLQETLKNFLLSGIHDFTIILDDAAQRTDSVDCFFDDEQLFGPAGLSPDANLQPILLDWQRAKDTLDWQTFTVILLLNVTNNTILEALSHIRASLPSFPPVLISLSTGQYGYTHLSLKEPHFIINTHPDHLIPDLRLYNPWPELYEYLNSFDFPQLDAIELSQIPYPLILFKVIQWHKTSFGELRSSKNLRDQIDSYYSSIGLCPYNDLNFMEAKRFAHLGIRTIDDDLETINELLSKCNVILETDCTAGVQWHDPFNYQMVVLLRTLKKYMSIFHNIPLSSNIPDMESSAYYYSTLKAIYERKILHDLSNFKKILSEITDIDIPDSMVQMFCANLKCLQCITSTEHYPIFELSKIFHGATFQSSENPPGNNGKECEGVPVISSFPTTVFIGGLVSQEIIKVITHQHSPINNSFIYDALKNEASTYTI